MLLAAGVAIGTNATTSWAITVGVILQTFGAAVLFPILVSFAYDRLRERWLGDEVWRLFGELADAGISRVYRDREYAEGRDNAQSRLSKEFLKHTDGPIYMIGPTLRVFFNPLGPFHRDIETMLRNGNGRVSIHGLIEQADSQAVCDRIEVEQPHLKPGEQPQTVRDAESTIAFASALCDELGACITLRRFVQAPYCTAIIFPHVAFFSPNLLAPQVPVRLPMILFESGSHGYRMLELSFRHIWSHPSTVEVVPAVSPHEHSAQLECPA